MTETGNSPHEEQLKVLLHDLTKDTVFAESPFGRDDLETITLLSRLFTDILNKGGFSDLNSLNVVMPGGNFYEVVAVLLAAKIVGIKHTQVTAVEINPDTHASNLSQLNSIYGQHNESKENVNMQVDGGNINLVNGDAADSRYNIFTMPSADAYMVFIGNSQNVLSGANNNMGEVFDNLATIGLADDKKLIFAATATRSIGERDQVAGMFKRAMELGSLQPVDGLDGVPNKYAIPTTTTSTAFSHSYVFVATRN